MEVLVLVLEIAAGVVVAWVVIQVLEAVAGSLWDGKER